MLRSDGGARRNREVGGPSISAIPFSEASGGKMTRLLGERERNLLARIAVTVRFARGEPIYREGDPARFVYDVSSGVARITRRLADGTRAVIAFLFPDDLFGLADYVGLSPAAVSRSFRTLAARHLVVFRDRRHLLTADHAGLASLIAQRGRE